MARSRLRCRIVLLLIIAALPVACQQSPDVGEGVVAARRPAPPVDGRIHYNVRSQPVFLAPDGSRRRIASLLAIPDKMTFGDYVWNDAVPKGGPIWLRIDLPRQLISVFRGANEIGTAVVVYGSDGTATPAGTFPILGKEQMHRSMAYDADMPYTLWLTHDGVALHASSVRRGRATHGCVGLPTEFARRLFAVAGRGDKAFILPAEPDASADI